MLIHYHVLLHNAMYPWCPAQQNTTVQVGNSSVLSESMRDNPLMQHYAAVYTMSMGIMLLLKLLRGIVFVKVRFYII